MLASLFPKICNENAFVGKKSPENMNENLQPVSIQYLLLWTEIQCHPTAVFDQAGDQHEDY